MIKEAWERFAAECVPADAEDVQRVETRRAFYAGALSLFAGICGAVEPGEGEPTAADMAVLDGVREEFQAYEAELARLADAEAKRGRRRGRR